MDGQSLTPDKIKLQQLQELLPEAFSEGKIDWEKLKATLGEDITFSNERYVLNWAGKSDAFKVLQTPSTRTLVPAKGESINFDETENIFIEGENLEVLKVLQKSYFGKVKMIYIDPPYNTGNDSFIYPDKFSETKDEYLKRVGDKDEEGYMTRDGMFRKNSRENGQYHSNWLNMMYPRMFLAKNLLREDGVIFVSIDDNEVHNLRLLMNEIFGEENFIEQIIWKNKYGAGAETKGFISTHEYILCFSKNPIKNLTAPLSEDEVKKHSRRDSKYHIRGGYRLQPLQTRSLGDRPSLVYPINYKGKEIWPIKQWVWSKERLLKAIQNDDVEIQEKDGKFSIDSKQYIKDENGNPRKGKPVSVLNGPFTQEGTQEIRELFDGKDVFDFPKPSLLIETLLNINIEPEEDDEIILDFFSGSCPTAHGLFRYNIRQGKNKKFICVQLPELCDDKSEAYKAGYKTIADIAKERIRRVIKKIEAEKAEAQKKKAGELTFDNPDNQGNQKNNSSDGFKVLKLSDSSFKQWQQIVGKDSKALEEQMKLFVDPVSKTATIENMVYELLLKSGKDINSKIEHKTVSPGEAEGYYCINSNELVFMLEKATPEIVDSVLKEQPQKVIALDRLFTGNDQLKTNTYLQMKDAGIEFKTI